VVRWEVAQAAPPPLEATRATATRATGYTCYRQRHRPSSYTVHGDTCHGCTCHGYTCYRLHLLQAAPPPLEAAERVARRRGRPHVEPAYPVLLERWELGLRHLLRGRL